MGIENTLCPHCGTRIYMPLHSLDAGRDPEGDKWIVLHSIPPCCGKKVFFLNFGQRDPVVISGHHEIPEGARLLVYPRSSARPPCPPEVPGEIAADYSEAALVLADSPKASAALSRRCLQSVLRDLAGAKGRNLDEEIQSVIDGRTLPNHLAESLDEVRVTGNFAAHPIKSTTSGAVLDVEPGEAEWNLEVLDGLFDFYCVQPAATKRRRDALNKKLGTAGKRPLKGAAEPPVTGSEDENPS